MTDEKRVVAIADPLSPSALLKLKMQKDRLTGQRPGARLFVVHELKSRRVSRERAQRQLEAYRKFFPAVMVVSSSERETIEGEFSGHTPASFIVDDPTSFIVDDPSPYMAVDPASPDLVSGPQEPQTAKTSRLAERAAKARRQFTPKQRKHP